MEIIIGIVLGVIVIALMVRKIKNAGSGKSCCK